MMRFVCLCLALTAFACGPAEKFNSSATDSSFDTTDFVDVSSKFSSHRKLSKKYQADETSAYRDPGEQPFPLMPEEDLTPGSRCTSPDEYRYPEHIPYCRRSVSKGKKDSVIRIYDKEHGYSIEDLNRQEFKIDHYIPLCMGGSNNNNNLWPQHEDMYVLTDPIEAKLCDMLARGEVKQAEAIEKMTYIKHHIDEAKALLQELKTNGFKNLR